MFSLPMGNLYMRIHLPLMAKIRMGGFVSIFLLTLMNLLRTNGDSQLVARLLIAEDNQ